MVKFLLIGLWVCAVALGSSYGAAYWAAGAAHAKADDPYPPGLDYRRLPPVTIPMVIDGQIKGYVLAKMVFTADAATLRKLPVDPSIFVTHSVFNEIYVNGRIESGKIAKYDLSAMMSRIKAAANTYIGGDVVQEVLVDSINYIDKTDMRSAAGNNAPLKNESKPAPKAKAAH
ncbi:hypothetical protein J5J86_02835 [Aquabacter sp. L1I39]|uniref:hypothetical protein n=1 Tax=Aquabacter sp. L1I39 TaxID=2820278 RepID=UPI001AD952B1|nr:hypothetical protein [Aquabacter sp. L1I39]QTL04300.1 hypothetical protein J5J86_02835 [Aquabacter sp. L1I39]